MTIAERAAKDGLITIPEAANLTKMSDQGFRKKLKTIPLPGYFVKIGKRYFVDPENLLFKAITPPQELSKNSELDQHDLSDLKSNLEQLKTKSINAKFLQEIQKYELNKYELEKKRLELKLQAGDIIETGFAEFLFIGYLEKLNRESLSFPKRIAREVGLIIKDGIHTNEPEKKMTDKIIKIVSREIEAILKDIKKEQKKDIDNWKETL